MKARRFSRICSRPFHSATPRRHVAFSAKQSKPFPKVLSSISFQKARSHAGGAAFFIVNVVITFSIEKNSRRKNRSRRVFVPNINPHGNARNYLRGNRDAPEIAPSWLDRIGH